MEGIVCKGRKPVGEEEGNSWADKARVTLGAQCLWDTKCRRQEATVPEGPSQGREGLLYLQVFS